LVLKKDSVEAINGKGQGTTNRHFEFANVMSEFLWIRDVFEAINTPLKQLLFPQRVANNQASPFGWVIKRKTHSELEAPFVGFEYPNYFRFNIK